MTENHSFGSYLLSVLSTIMFMEVQPIATCGDMKEQVGAIQTSKNMIRALAPQFLLTSSVVLASIVPTIIVLDTFSIYGSFVNYFSVAIVGWISYKLPIEEELQEHNLCGFDGGKYEHSGYWKIIAQNSVYQNLILLIAALVGSAFAWLNLAVASVLAFILPITEERVRNTTPRFSMSLILSYTVTMVAWKVSRGGTMVVKILDSELRATTTTTSQPEGLLIEEQDAQLWNDESASFLNEQKETITEEFARHAR